ncbi:MAG: hypothetical protein R2822_30410 [Spirosomataceae bacterium]
MTNLEKFPQSPRIQQKTVQAELTNVELDLEVMRQQNNNESIQSGSERFGKTQKANLTVENVPYQSSTQRKETMFPIFNKWVLTTCLLTKSPF